MPTLLHLRTRFASAGIAPDEARHLAALGHIEHLDVLAARYTDAPRVVRCCGRFIAFYGNGHMTCLRCDKEAR